MPIVSEEKGCMGILPCDSVQAANNSSPRMKSSRWVPEMMPMLVSGRLSGRTGVSECLLYS